MNIGVLGTGNIAESMAKTLNGMGDEVVAYAVASRGIEKAEAFAKKWNFKKAYGSYEELAADDNIDLIYVATPHAMHYENAKLCLKYGRNLLVEKAFTSNCTEARELLALAKEKGCFITEAVWTRFMPVKGIVDDIIASGKIGNTTYLEGYFNIDASNVPRLVRPELAGGALLDVGIYVLTFARMYFGTDIASVKAECIPYETGVDRTDNIVITYKDGRMAKLQASMREDFKLEGKIVGTKGYLHVNSMCNPSLVKVYNMDGELLEEINVPEQITGYEYEVRSAIKAIKEGRGECPEMPHAETLRILGWMDSMRYKWDMIYPYENKEDLEHDPVKVWGLENPWDDKNPWDRSNHKSFLEIYNIETKTRRVVAEMDYVIEAPNWTSDGKYLVYNSEGLIYKFNLSTGEITKVEMGFVNNCNNDHVLSPDGLEIAVSHHCAEDGLSRIFTAPLAGGEPKLITEKAPSYLHGWNPNNKDMIFCAERNGEYDVYKIDLETKEETRLTSAPCLNDGCEYDVNGEYIWFNSVRSGLMQAWRMKADGSEQTQMTFDEDLNTWFPHISPDLKKVVMVSYKKGDLLPGDHVPGKYVAIRMMDADGSNLTTLFELFGGQGTINVNSWSPDSKEFAFVSYAEK